MESRTLPPPPPETVYCVRFEQPASHGKVTPENWHIAMIELARQDDVLLREGDPDTVQMMQELAGASRTKHARRQEALAACKARAKAQEEAAKKAQKGAGR